MVAPIPKRLVIEVGEVMMLKIIGGQSLEGMLKSDRREMYLSGNKINTFCHNNQILTTSNI